MKKIELKFWLSCMMMALCIGFTACDDDDEGIDGDASTLILGTWEAYWDKGYTIYHGEKETWDERITDEGSYTFKKGGYGFVTEYDTNESEEITWSISGNKLKIELVKYNEIDEFVIKTLNSNTLIFIDYEKDEDGEYYDEVTFKKKK